MGYMIRTFDQHSVVQMIGELNLEVDPYVHFHKIRYAYILNEVARLLASEPLHDVLDVGPSFQTLLMRQAFPTLQISSLGTNHTANHLREGESHWNIDLNFTEQFDHSKLGKQFDLLVFAEVIEHLFTKPEIVLSFLRTLLKPQGILLLQTPNAVAIDKRIKILGGKNPYQLIDESRRNHYREYTRRELRGILLEAGFEITKMETQNYFSPDRTAGQKIFQRASPLIPRGWRDGISVICRKTNT